MKPDCAKPEGDCLIPDWCAENGCVRNVPERVITDNQIDGAISVLREWRNDGADGESAHLLCDGVLQLRALADRRRLLLQDIARILDIPVNDCATAEAMCAWLYSYRDTSQYQAEEAAQLNADLATLRIIANGKLPDTWASGDVFTSPTASGIGLKLHELLAVQDHPDMDATDAAHPAWWRGHDSGARGVALALIKVAVAGRSGGTFAGQEVELAAGAIQDLRERLQLAETARDELSDALDRERLQHDETRGYRHQAELDRDGCRESYAKLDANWERHHEACMAPIRAALDKPDGSILELVNRITELRASERKE